MKTKIYLVRHGETEWNASGRFQGCHDISLSNAGIVQAEFLNLRFQGKYDCIYTSPLKRAMETSKIICNNTNIKPIIEKELREINFGLWEGLTINEIKLKYSNEFESWRNDEDQGPLLGGDLSLKAASIRAKNAIIKIVKNNSGKKIIIVAHGGIIKAALIGIFQWKMTMYHKIMLANTSVSTVAFDNLIYPTLINLNDISHIPQNYSIKSYV